MIPASTLAALCAEDYTKPAAVERPGLHVQFTPAYGNSIIASFRGSEDLADWVLDFDTGTIRVAKYPKLDAIPEGFADDVLSAYAELRSGLTGAECIVLTGHSRGGLQAQILGALLVIDGVSVDQITTFGAPRGGQLGGQLEKVAVAEWYINGNDPVPGEPFFLSSPRPDARRYIGVKRTWGVTAADHFIASYQASLLVANIVPATAA